MPELLINSDNAWLTILGCFLFLVGTVGAWLHGRFRAWEREQDRLNHSRLVENLTRTENAKRAALRGRIG